MSVVGGQSGKHLLVASISPFGPQRTPCNSLYLVRDRLTRRKRLDDAALGNGAVAALADYTVEFTPQRREIGDLAVHFREVFTSNGINGLARAAALIGQSERPADLRKGETETARSSDETPSV
jgi:hypothetical protein